MAAVAATASKPTHSVVFLSVHAYEPKGISPTSEPTYAPQNARLARIGMYALPTGLLTDRLIDSGMEWDEVHPNQQTAARVDFHVDAKRDTLSEWWSGKVFSLSQYLSEQGGVVYLVAPRGFGWDFNILLRAMARHGLRVPTGVDLRVCDLRTLYHFLLDRDMPDDASLAASTPAAIVHPVDECKAWAERLMQDVTETVRVVPAGSTVVASTALDQVPTPEQTQHAILEACERYAMKVDKYFSTFSDTFSVEVKREWRVHEGMAMGIAESVMRTATKEMESSLDKEIAPLPTALQRQAMVLFSPLPVSPAPRVEGIRPDLGLTGFTHKDLLESTCIQLRIQAEVTTGLQLVDWAGEDAKAKITALKRVSKEQKAFLLALYHSFVL